MNILITGGGGGFIGGMLVQELEKSDHNITLFGHTAPGYPTSAEFIFGDILDEEKLAQLGEYDATIHMAGILGTSVTFGHIKKTAEVNIIGTLNVLERQRHGGIFIQPNLLGTWLNPYMITKNAAERFGLMYDNEFPMKYISIRLTDTFGPRQSIHHGKAIPTFMKKAIKNEPLPIYGSGEYEMQLLYVKDVAKVFAGTVEHWESLPRVIDIVSSQMDNHISVASLARKIIRLTGSSSELEFMPMRRGQPKSVTGYDADLDQSQCVMKQLNVVETPHDIALKETIDWYRYEIESGKLC